MPTDATSQTLFPASALARVLGCSLPTARQRLADAPPSGRVLVGGNLAEAWSFSALSVSLQSDLDAVAQERGCRNAEALLSEPAQPWQPKIPIAQAAPDAIDRAAKLRAALLPSLEKRHGNNGTQAEFEEAGRAAYAKAFGYDVSGRWFRELFSRTIRRDRGLEDFHRLEIYLDDNICAAPVHRVAASYDHAPLAERLAFSGKPSMAARQNALEYSFRHFDELAAAHPGESKQVKRSVLAFLYSAAPSLARTPGALKRNWNRLYAAWLEGGKTPDAVKDGRAEAKPGQHLKALEGDLQLIVAEAFHHDGKLALAIRKLRKAGKLSAAFVNRYTLDVRRHKSHVARSLRDEITARLTGLLAYRRSKFQVDMEGPRIAREHSYNPGDYFAADDVSFNIYFWTLDDAGRPFVTRGECLLFFDCRSLYPLGYVLTPGKYNGETIRRGLLNIHDKHGLPHRAFIFERGVWESRLIEGSRPRDFLGWDEYEMGLRQRGLGVEVRHAVTPQGKLIEGIFNILQQNQRNLPGFAGFNERDYGQEALQKFNAQVKRGGVHPRGKFLSMEQWSETLDRSLEEYAAEPQNGQLLQGKSPAEKWAEHQPLRKLPDDARFLLASHRVRAKVKANGIGLTIRGQRRFYYSSALGDAFLGRQVFAWFNLEEPDLLTVSSLDMKQVLTVRRQVLSAFDATKDQLAEAHRQRRGFMQSAKIRFDNIQHGPRRSITRDNVIDDEAQKLGESIRLETSRFREEKAEETRQLNRLARNAEEAGISLPVNVRNPESVQRGLELLKQSASDVDTGEQAVKTYILKSGPACQPKATPQTYWALWARIEKARPDLKPMRHAITRKALHIAAHLNPSPKDMTPAQLAKMIEVFKAILRDSKEPAL